MVVEFFKKLFAKNDDKRIIDEFKEMIENDKLELQEMKANKAVNDQITDSVTQAEPKQEKPKKPRAPRKKKVE